MKSLYWRSSGIVCYVLVDPESGEERTDMLRGFFCVVKIFV